MTKLELFELSQKKIRSLDFSVDPRDDSMFDLFKERNSFWLDRDMPIHRIFQREFLDIDLRDGYLTMPLARAAVWNDALENPLANIFVTDDVTGAPVHLGALTSSFHALCWTKRDYATTTDWESFSHGKPSDRVSTTVGKLLDRLMLKADSAYMHRVWVIEVDYKDPQLIAAMKSPQELYSRMDGQGALFALSTAVVQTKHRSEDEVRLLFDPSISPAPTNSKLVTGNLLRVPFDWSDFIDKRVQRPI